MTSMWYPLQRGLNLALSPSTNPSKGDIDTKKHPKEWLVLDFLTVDPSGTPLTAQASLVPAPSPRPQGIQMLSSSYPSEIIKGE
jgi:hypothetical protein